MSLLRCENLTIGYKKKEILKGLNFVLQKGVLTALLGKNGVGKSTFLKTITGEIPSLGGKTEIEGEPLSKYSRKKISKKIALVTTEQVNAGALLVREVVAMGRHPYTGMLGRLSEEDKRIVETSMSNAGIIHKSNDYFNELSDGEKQKVMIARALAQDTPIIVLDEPFSFLDVSSRIELLTLLSRLARDEGKGILFSSHDVSQALRMSDFISIITTEGELISGTTEEILNRGDIERLFNNENIMFSEKEMDFVSRK